MRRAVLALPALLSLTASPAAAESVCYAYGNAAVVGHLTELSESSGLAASILNPGVLWTHNDSGDDPRFYALQGDGSILATVEVGGAQAVDWEDMAVGPCGTCACLFAADIGDNEALRPNGTVYRIAEPLVKAAAGGATVTVQVERALTFVYPDGAHNAETFFVDPRTAIPYIVTKEKDGHDAVYRFPSADPTTLPATLIKVADLDFVRHGPLGRLTTGGSMSPDGARLVIRTYDDAYEWWIGEDSVEDALAGEPDRVDLPHRKQGEAIAYSADGQALYLTTEGVDGRLDKLSCISGSPLATPVPALGARCASSVSIP